MRGRASATQCCAQEGRVTGLTLSQVRLQLRRRCCRRLGRTTRRQSCKAETREVSRIAPVGNGKGRRRGSLLAAQTHVTGCRQRSSSLAHDKAPGQESSSNLYTVDSCYTRMGTLQRCVVTSSANAYTRRPRAVSRSRHDHIKIVSSPRGIVSYDGVYALKCPSRSELAFLLECCHSAKHLSRRVHGRLSARRRWCARLPPMDCDSRRAELSCYTGVERNVKSRRWALSDRSS
jgi:hypothetical protein